MIYHKPNPSTLNCCARCKNGAKILTNVVITHDGTHTHLCDDCARKYYRRIKELATVNEEQTCLITR